LLHMINHFAGVYTPADRFFSNSLWKMTDQQ
jgi:hypothetical protein